MSSNQPQRSYLCAYVQCIITRNSMEKPTVRVFFHEVEILREIYQPGNVQIVPTDSNAGGDTHRRIDAAEEYARLETKYGQKGEGDSGESWVNYVYGRQGREEWHKALTDSAAYKAEVSSLDPDTGDPAGPAEAPAPVTRLEERQGKRVRQIRAREALDELGIEWKGNMSADALEELLEDARVTSLSDELDELGVEHEEGMDAAALAALLDEAEGTAATDAEA